MYEREGGRERERERQREKEEEQEEKSIWILQGGVERERGGKIQRKGGSWVCRYSALHFRLPFPMRSFFECYATCSPNSTDLDRGLSMTTHNHLQILMVFM